MSFRRKIQGKVTETFHYVVEKPLLTAASVLVLVTVVVTGLSLPYYISQPEAFWTQILAEAHGMIFDIAVIGILLFWLNQSGEIRREIRTYKDEIDDFRSWNSEEAAFRTVGNIKRLNRHSIHEINLVGAHLPRTNLNYINLSGSNINTADLSNASLIGTNLENTRLNQTNFENANLNQCSLRSAYAGGANFKDAYLIKAQLQHAFLIKSSFVNAYLMEANLQNAYLMGADFESASLYKADFRGAKGLTVEQLAKAKTLYLAQFDDELHEQVKQLMPELVNA